MTVLKKVNHAFMTVIKGLLILFGTTMTVLVIMNVILRYAFSSGLTWSEEASRFLFIWVTFLGSILANDAGIHGEHMSTQLATLLDEKLILARPDIIGAISHPEHGILDSGHYIDINLQSRTEAGMLIVSQLDGERDDTILRERSHITHRSLQFLITQTHDCLATGSNPVAVGIRDLTLYLKMGKVRENGHPLALSDLGTNLVINVGQDSRSGRSYTGILKGSFSLEHNGAGANNTRNVRFKKSPVEYIYQ